jgi:hypothetical protein
MISDSTLLEIDSLYTEGVRGEIPILSDAKVVELRSIIEECGAIMISGALVNVNITGGLTSLNPVDRSISRAHSMIRSNLTSARGDTFAGPYITSNGTYYSNGVAIWQIDHKLREPTIKIGA